MGYKSIIISSSARITVKNEQLVIEGEKSGSVPIEDIRTLMIESRASFEKNVARYCCGKNKKPSEMLGAMWS